MPQTKIILQCSECEMRNYVTTKNRQNVPDNLTLNKFCPKCGRHTKHEEKRLRR